jgi:hypothetical protein
MTYETLDSINTSEGLHTLYTYANSVVPILTPLLLFGLFLIVMMVSYFSSIRLRGDANFSASFAVAGFFIATVGTFMSFIPGMINLTTLVVCYGIAIIGFMWLILDKN